MVCIGPRKREKNSTDTASLDDATIGGGTRGISNSNSGGATTKRASKLKPPNKIAHTAKTTGMGTGTATATATKTTTTATMTNKRNTTTSRKPISPRPSVDGRPTPKRKPRTPLNNQQHSNNIPRPNHRQPISPQTSPRQSMVSARKTTPATKVAQSRNTNTASTKKSPVAQMRQDYDILKSKYDANEQLIAKQQAELELLKQQLACVSPPSTPVPPPLADQPTPPISQSNTLADLHQTQRLPEENEELSHQENETSVQLRRKLEQISKNGIASDSIVVKPSMDDEDDHGDENDSKMEQEQKRLTLEQMTSQLDKLRLENEETTRQLTLKEKELDDLRTSIQYGTGGTSSSNSSIISSSDESSETVVKLQQELDEHKRLHVKSLRQHEMAMIEKERMLKAQEEALEQLKSAHTESIRQLKTQQTSNILKMKQKHKQDMLDLQERLHQVEQSKQEQLQQQGDLAKRQQEQLDGELEKMLIDFEQAEHNHMVQLQTMEQSHQTAISDLQQSQQVVADRQQYNTMMIGKSQGYTSTKYVPYEAVSWPAPQPLSMLRKTSGPSPRPNRVLLTATASSSEPLLTPLDTKKVQVYVSTVSGNPIIKKNQERIQQILKSRNISFELVDVAASEIALQYMKRSNNNGSAEGRAKEVPQLFVGGEFRGLFNEVAKHDEDGTLDSLLVPAAERKWTAAERQAIEKATIGSASSLSSSLNHSSNNNNSSSSIIPPAPVRVLPSGPVPTSSLRQVKPKTKTVAPGTLDDEDEAILKELEQEFCQGKVDLSELDQI